MVFSTVRRGSVRGLVGARDARVWSQRLTEWARIELPGRQASPLTERASRRIRLALKRGLQVK
jgi:hypothetical protein